MSAANQISQFRGKISRKLTILMIVTVILPLLAAGAGGYISLSHYALHLLDNQLAHSETITQDSVGDSLLAKSARLDAILHRASFQRHLHDLIISPPHSSLRYFYAKQIRQDLAPVIKYNSPPVFNNIFIINKGDMRIIVSTRPAWQEMSLKSTQTADLIKKAFGASVEGQDPYGGRHYFLYGMPPLYNNETILASLYRYKDDKSGKVVYILGTSEESAIETMLAPLEATTPNSIGFLITENGTYISQDPKTLLLRALPAPSILFKTWQAKTKGEFTVSYPSPAMGEKVIAHVRWVPEWHASVGVEVPEKIFYQPIHKLAWLIVELDLLLLLLLAAAIGIVSRHFTKPILEIAHNARRFAEGEWQIRAPVKRNDEIGILAYSFNQMADQLSELYYSLEDKVNLRAGQIRTAAEVAILATSAESLDEILKRTVDLIVERFPQYYHASVFLLDRDGEYAVLKASTGEVGEIMLAQGHKLAVNSASVVGYATEHNEPRVIQNTSHADTYYKNPLLPETKAEAAIPISIGDRVLGALDVQSKEPNVFDEIAVDTLQTLASLLAIAIHSARLRERAQVNLEEINILYHSVLALTHAKSADDFNNIAIQTLKRLPVLSAIVSRRNGNAFDLNIVSGTKAATHIPSVIAPPNILKELFPPHAAITVNDLDKPEGAPRLLIDWAKALGYRSVCAIPFYINDELQVIMLLGSEQKGDFPETRTEAYELVLRVAEQLLVQLINLHRAQNRVDRLEITVKIAKQMLSATGKQSRIKAIKEHLTAKFGEVGFALVLYDALKRQISFPYAYLPGEGEKNYPTIPLGDGPISQTLLNRRSMVLDESEISLLPAEGFSHEAKMWISVPLLAQDELIGALVLADFKEHVTLRGKHLRIIEQLADMIALIIRQLRQSELHMQQAKREHLLFQMNERLRRAYNIQQVMEIALQQIQDALEIQRGVIRITPITKAEKPNEPPRGEA